MLLGSKYSCTHNNHLNQHIIMVPPRQHAFNFTFTPWCRVARCSTRNI